MRKVVNALFKQFYRQRYRRIQAYLADPHGTQRQQWRALVAAGRNTAWGRAHQLDQVRTPADFAASMPISEYDNLKPFIQRMMHGERNVLWPGTVQWFSKSSGTTNDKSKFIPVSAQNLRQGHLRGTWDTMTFYYHQRPQARQFADKTMLMGGSWSTFAPFPATRIGDVSAIMIQQMPWVARPFFIPDLPTALLPDWEEKLERLAQIGARERQVVMISGVPTWTVVLLRRILELTGAKHLLEVWPHFQLYTHGGVSFKPYQQQFRDFFPTPEIDYQEIYNASEGFFAVQDDLEQDGLLLLLNNGIYFEFIPMAEWSKPTMRAEPLEAVEVGKNYAVVITTNSGLWRYCLGDTVQFTSTAPYRIKVTGRTKQFVNAFGEELMVDNADMALAKTCHQLGARVREYTVAPIYFDGANRGGHEWLIEFEQEPQDLSKFSLLLDENLQKINSDYEAKRHRNLAMLPLQIHVAPPGTFYNWMRARGKFGGQHKVPRLSNHRDTFEDVMSFVSSGS